MQIRLTPDNEKLLGIYRELCRQVLPAYNEKEGSIVNGMLTEKLRAEIERLKRKGK
jgi:hypothetical protein